MALQTARDLSVLIRSENSSSERRITPSWTLAHLKTKLEPITGIPSSCQKLTLKIPGQHQVTMEAQDEEMTQLDNWRLQAHAEIYVLDTRPPSARTNLTDVSTVPKYTMPVSTYETLSDSVLAWKKSQKLGRFDPLQPEHEAAKIRKMWDDVSKRKIEPSARCRLGGEDARRGTVAFVGDVEELPGKGPWVGVSLDEPLGKHDGSVGGKKYFSCGEKNGVFVRPDRVEIGKWGVLADEELEEI